jgi:hypothetical protein
VRFKSQKGDSELVRLVPPTWKELVRNVKDEFKMDGEPALYHGDEVGRVRKLTEEAHFEHMVTITPRNRYMTVIIGAYKEKCGLQCCCCGRSDKPPDLPKGDPLDPISDIGLGPPGLRNILVEQSIYGRWNDPDVVQEKKDKDGPSLMFQDFM